MGSASTRRNATFQPTLPARGATPQITSKSSVVADFNPRSPHGERRRRFPSLRTRRGISTHAHRTGSDGCPALIGQFFLEFQPTLPARGATVSSRGCAVKFAISTHAPRTGSDERPRPGKTGTHSDFNPRSPHGERLRSLGLWRDKYIFQPTLPARGATRPHRRRRDSDSISTHAPRTGSDTPEPKGTKEAVISTHAPRTGSDEQRQRRILPECLISTHAPRTGSDGSTPTTTAR